MDVSALDFEAQKVLHQAFRIAKKKAHPHLEVEHVALAFLAIKAEKGPKTLELIATLEAHIESLPRIYGLKKLEYTHRLKETLAKAEAEAKSKSKPLSALEFWSLLQRNSTFLKNALLRASLETPETPPPHSGTPPRAEGPEARKEAEPKSPDSDLLAYAIDLTALAQGGSIDPVVGRDQILRRMVEILGRRKKNNPILLGEPGVGKTALAEALALLLVSPEAPEALKGQRLLRLDLGLMLAGAKFRGEFEERLTKFLRALGQSEAKYIVFIDEIHTLTGTGNQEGTLDAANLLKPALARGDIQCVGATTWEEYRKFIEKDRALERRFQPLSVEEPTRAQCLGILRALKTHYEKFHGVGIEDQAIEAAVDLSIRYLSSRQLPDKAIDIIDEASSKVRIELSSKPQKMQELAKRIEAIKLELNAIHKGRSPLGKTPTGAIKLEVELTGLEAKLKELEAAWTLYRNLLDSLRALEKESLDQEELRKEALSQESFSFAAEVTYELQPKVKAEHERLSAEIEKIQDEFQFFGPRVGAREVSSVVAEWAKVPLDHILNQSQNSILSIAAILRQSIIGQDQALDPLIRALKRAQAGIQQTNRPLGTFLFLGPSGVGKTETAKTLSHAMYPEQDQLLRIDLSEYTEAHHLARLIGPPPGYIGYGDRAELTEPVRTNPYRVILFDEIDKAHPKVWDLLLQLFDAGRLTDSKGRLVDFTNCICIMTANINRDYEQAHDDYLRRSLSPPFRVEFINRIDEIIRFKTLEAKDFTRMVEAELKVLNLRLSKKQLRLDLDSEVKKSLIERALKSQFGARGLKRFFQRDIADPLSDLILNGGPMGRGFYKVIFTEVGNIGFVRDYTDQKLLSGSNKAS